MLVGRDEDALLLLESATKIARRVVVKRANNDAPLGGDPAHAIHGKLVRYDVYLQTS